MSFILSKFSLAPHTISENNVDELPRKTQDETKAEENREDAGDHGKRMGTQGASRTLAGVFVVTPSL